MTNSMISKLVRILGLALLAGACANNAPPPTLDRGDDLAVDRPVIRAMDRAVASKNQRAGRGAALGAVGAVGGAAVGGTVGGLLGLGCGPAAIICVPMAMAAGGGIGAAGGAAAGVSHGGRGGIAAAHAERFNELAGGIMDENLVAKRLHGQLQQLANVHWTLDSHSDNRLALEVTSIRFRQSGSETVQLVINADMRLELGGRSHTVALQQTSMRRHVTYWLAGDGANFEWELDEALEGLAHAMIERLASESRVAGAPAAISKCVGSVDGCSA